MQVEATVKQASPSPRVGVKVRKHSRGVPLGLTAPNTALRYAVHLDLCANIFIESILMMGDRQRKPAASEHLPRNTLGSIQIPQFNFRAPYPPGNLAFKSGKAPSPTKILAHDTGFRVPSPTQSEEEEIEALENDLPVFSPDYSEAQAPDSADQRSEHLSRLGDSSSLFATPPSAEYTFRSPPHSTSMVVEREPPKAPPLARRADEQPPRAPLSHFQQQPEFGKASPLQNRLTSSHVFNIPKPHKAHPEFHRPAQPLFQNPNVYGQRFEQAVSPQAKPSQLVPQLSKPAYALQNNGDVIEIPKPINFPPQPTYAHPPPEFTTRPTTGFTAVNPYNRPGNVVDLTTEPALFDDKFGAVDPYEYIDAGKATDNIKALLEGAFEDEEDKPRTRGRKKKVEAAVEKLKDKLEDLEFKTKDQKGEGSKFEEAEEDEEEDDGTIEGLKVKLLPHQMEGVEWMRDKETTQKKTKGVLPKGGILADDVGSSLVLRVHLADVLLRYRWV